MKQPHNIYIHVPFCMSKCNYCAFWSIACANPDWKTYLAGILAELDYWGRILGRVRVPTVFFGGGTPSLMPVDCFSQIMNKIRTCFDLPTDAEITLESNPGTLDENKMREFQAAGVNRLSIGVQSLDDKKLKFLGRRHDAATAIAAIKTAQKLNLNVSADFIYGLPGDNVATVIETCAAINKLGLTHCSMYELTIEENTPFGRANLNMPTNEEMADMYTAIRQNLSLPRYEVSNYATPGHECRHNQNIWDGDAYIGIGRGAAGRVYIDGTWYEQRGAGELFEPLSSTDRTIECVITGLRTIRGVCLTDPVKAVINMDIVQSMPDKIRIVNDRLVATDMGMLVLDDLIEQVTR